MLRSGSYVACPLSLSIQYQVMITERQLPELAWSGQTPTAPQWALCFIFCQWGEQRSNHEKKTLPGAVTYTK